jgi:succinate-acetate transporter protein
MKKIITHFINKIKLLIVDLHTEKSRFKNLFKKNIFFNKFLFYYGVFTFGLLFIEDVSNSETFVILGRVLYLLFYVALIFKFYLSIN